VSAVVDRHSLQVVLYALLRKNRRSLAIQGACNDLDPVFTNPGFGKKAGNQPEMKTSPISTSRLNIFAWSAEKGLFPPAAF
jgi:hypothetical protein